LATAKGEDSWTVTARMERRGKREGKKKKKKKKTGRRNKEKRTQQVTSKFVQVGGSMGEGPKMAVEKTRGADKRGKRTL